MAIFGLMIVLSSCSSNNNVVSNGFIQKRKYQKGFHLDLVKKQHSNSHFYVESGSTQKEDKKADEQIKSSDFQANVLGEIKDESSSTNSEKRISRESILEMKPTSVSHHLKELKQILPSKPKDGIEPDKEAKSSETAGVSLILAIAAWACALFATIVSFTGIPIVPSILLLLALISSIVAVSLASKDRKSNDLARVAFILGWIYLILTMLTVLIVAFFLILFIILLTSF